MDNKDEILAELVPKSKGNYRVKLQDTIYKIDKHDCLEIEQNPDSFVWIKNWKINTNSKCVHTENILVNTSKIKWIKKIGSCEIQARLEE